MEKITNETFLFSYLYDNSTLDEFADPYAEEEFLNIDENIDKEILIRNVYDVLDNKLTFKERQVVCMVFGLSGEDPHSVTDVASILRVTESNIYKILKKAINKIRDYINE